MLSMSAQQSLLSIVLHPKMNLLSTGSPLFAPGEAQHHLTAEEKMMQMQFK